MQTSSDDYFMNEALKEALKAYEEDEVPVGAIIVTGHKIIGRGYNQCERLKDATAHAEMIAITSACNYLGSKYLHNCTLYVTVEPCIMCAGALRWSQVSRVVFGAREEKFGFTQKGLDLLHPSTELVQGVLSETCAALMKNFFKRLR
ncbi:MAG: nucleoside deaminase [Cytophagaceae bacterium]|nr:nucleoside deaminase [Cytophagaceae bacterium]MDW8457167.1 nucleoside deaminase [Cytophagaceae bacterium]